MEMKYGRLFNLENGEQEYIEVSGECDMPYQMDNEMESLKYRVSRYHRNTEECNKARRKLPENLPQKSDSKGLSTWETALLITVCTIYIIVLHVCPMWLKGVIVSSTILWTIYCYVKEEKNEHRKSGADPEAAQQMEERGRYTDGESY